MNQKGRRICAELCVAMLSLVACSCSLLANTPALPDAVVKAQTIFVDNQTGFAELGYTAILELNKWGRFEVVGSREKADIVMQLSNGTVVRPTPGGSASGLRGVTAFTDEGVPQGRTRITLINPKTGESLWSDLHRTEGPRVKNGHLLDGLREAFESYEKGKNRR